MKGEILAARFGPMSEKYSLKLVAIEVGSEISSPLLLKQEGQVSLDLRLLSNSLRIFHLVFMSVLEVYDHRSFFSQSLLGDLAYFQKILSLFNSDTWVLKKILVKFSFICPMDFKMPLVRQGLRHDF